MTLPHLAARVFGAPLLISRAKLDVLLCVLGPRLNLATETTGPEIAARKQASAPAAHAAPGLTIAVLPVHGTLVKRALALQAESGLLSYDALGAQLDAALADPTVAGILLDIDSPGGEVGGCFELARKVRAASAIKPVWALANDAAFSAAYALGCAADRLFVTETGGVGSIGVIALHVDQSAADAQDGLRYTAITAGARKSDYSPHAPLSEPAHSSLQTEVNRLYALFTAHVAAMRGLQESAVRDTEAGLFFAADAVRAGLADGVSTLDATVRAFAEFLSSRSRLPTPARTPLAGSARSQKDSPMHDDSPSPTDPIPTASATTDLDARIAQARADAAEQAQASAQAIADLCLIAGVPERAAAFIAAGSTEAAVRRALIEARASAQVDIRSTIAPDAAVAARPEDSPVVAAAKKLSAKE